MYKTKEIIDHAIHSLARGHAGATCHQGVHYGPPNTWFIIRAIDALVVRNKAMSDALQAFFRLIHGSRLIFHLAPIGWQQICDAQKRYAFAFNGNGRDLRQLCVHAVLVGHG